jgi:hypothetical protein
MVLDTCALVTVGVGEVPRWQGQLTFAMARHAAVDLALIFNTAPVEPPADRLPPKERRRLVDVLSAAGLPLSDAAGVEERLAELRALYEPYVYALSRYLALPLPPLLPERAEPDNWQTTAWKTVRHF